MSGSRKIERDHYLFREGDAPDAMYVVKSGKFVVVKTKNNSEIVLAEMGAGAMVGEMAFFDNKPRSASVRATKDSEVIVLPYKALHAQFANFPEWCKAIMRTINDHLRSANARLKVLEKAAGEEEEIFPPHTINKLMAILGFVATKFGKASPTGEVEFSGSTLRTYTIQIFQEATHKMQKLMVCLGELGILKLEELGEGRQKITIKNVDQLFRFLEWHNDWLFKPEADRITIKEEELAVLAGVVQYASTRERNQKGQVKINLTELQNDSMKDLGFLIKVDDLNVLIEKHMMSEKTMEQNGIFSTINLDDVERLVPFWKLLYALKKVTR